MREYIDGETHFMVDEEAIGVVLKMLDRRAFLEAVRYLHKRGYSTSAIQLITTDVYGVPRNCAGFLVQWQPEKSDAEQQDVNASFFSLAKGYKNLQTYLDNQSWS